MNKQYGENHMFCKYNRSASWRRAMGQRCFRNHCQLVQGYEFLHLCRTMDCRIQIGGSDQWENIFIGTELIRRIVGGEVYALTCPLNTKANGGKFGKTVKGSDWLDPERTSSYKF